MKRFFRRFLPIADVILLPFVYPAAWLLKTIRRAGVHRLTHCKKALLNVGVFPIRNHYYEPQFDNRNIDSDYVGERRLPGIDWNSIGQLELLDAFRYSGELANLQEERGSKVPVFRFNNGAFESGDAEYWYQIIRCFKPMRIFEIGSGNSTLVAIHAIRKNRSEDPSYRCEHVCIEPYEVPWLEQVGVRVIRKKAEEIDVSLFSELNKNDILFIDSSHIIRPRGDVLFEYLELLPSLKKGVIVHVHDIFSPRNYPSQWLRDEVRFWNEQYLLEAFLTHNKSWKILGALNYLCHNHYEKLKLATPFLSPGREPGSFYIQKIA